MPDPQRRAPEEPERHGRSPREIPYVPSYTVPDKMSNPSKGPQTREEVLAYVDGKLKGEGEYAIEGDTLEAKVKRVIAVQFDLRKLYFKDGDPAVTKQSKEELLKMLMEVQSYIFELAHARRKDVQTTTKTENSMPPDAKLKENTTIIISEDAETEDLNKAGWLGEASPTDKLEFPDKGAIITIKGTAYVKCKIEHPFPDGITKTYIGYIKAECFDKNPIKIPINQPDKPLDTVINKGEKPIAPLPPSSTKVEDVKMATEFMSTVSIESGSIETSNDGKTITIKLKDSTITMDISGSKDKVPFTMSNSTTKIKGTFEKTSTGHTTSFLNPKDESKTTLIITNEKTATFNPNTGAPIQITATDSKDLISKLTELGKTNSEELKDILKFIGSKPETVESKTSNVLLMGDSITVGMKDHFPGAYKAYEGAKQTDWMRTELDKFLKERSEGKHQNITTLVIGGGFNDLTSTVGYDKIVENLGYIFEKAKAAGLKVVAWTIPDWDYEKIHPILVQRWKDKGWGKPPGEYPFKTPQEMKAETEKINAWIKSQVGKNVDTVVDVYGKGFKFDSEGIHRTKEGSEKMAAFIKTQANISDGTRPAAAPAPTANPTTRPDRRAPEPAPEIHKRLFD